MVCDSILRVERFDKTRVLQPIETIETLTLHSYVKKE
jgi:hypothetical protein